MDNPFKIYIDRLTDSTVVTIEEVISPEFMQIQENDLFFSTPISVKGQAYLTDDHLVLDLSINTEVQLPCLVCNEKICLPISIRDTLHVEDLKTLKTAIYDYSEEIRNSVLLKIPHFIECQGGFCPDRKNISKFLKNSDKETYSPFSDLSL